MGDSQDNLIEGVLVTKQEGSMPLSDLYSQIAASLTDKFGVPLPATFTEFAADYLKDGGIPTSSLGKVIPWVKRARSAYPIVTTMVVDTAAGELISDPKVHGALAQHLVTFLRGSNVELKGEVTLGQLVQKALVLIPEEWLEEDSTSSNLNGHETKEFKCFACGVVNK